MYLWNCFFYFSLFFCENSCIWLLYLREFTWDLCLYKYVFTTFAWETLRNVVLIASATWRLVRGIVGVNNDVGKYDGRTCLAIVFSHINLRVKPTYMWNPNFSKHIYIYTQYISNLTNLQLQMQRKGFRKDCIIRILIMQMKR